MINMNVLLTGASGFVGRHVLLALQKQGYRTHAVYRTAPAPKDCAKNVVRVIVDMSPRTDWEEILEGIDAVIHTGDGLRVFEGQKTAPSDTASGDGAVATTMALARAAQASSVRTFVYLSSIKAASGYCASHVLSESDAPSPGRPFYGKLKARLEGQLASLGTQRESGGMYMVSLRSPIVYGVGGTGNFGRLVALADTPFPLPLANMSNRRSIVSVANLADGLVRAAENPNSCAGHYFIHDGPPLAMAELVALLREALGRRRRLFPVPGLLARMAGNLPVAGPVVSRLSRDLEVSSKKFETDFGWQPPQPAREALYAMARETLVK